MESGRYDFLRKKLFKLDRATQAREMRTLVAAPDFELGSVHAITEAGELVEASASGSRMGPYSGSSGQLILVFLDIRERLLRIDRRLRDWKTPTEPESPMMERLRPRSRP